MTPDRDATIRAFLADAGWGAARRARLAGDASTRGYERLALGGTTAILLDQPQGAETAACPPEASEAERKALGYNAVARLAGPDVRAFAAVGAYLNARGLAAPRLIAQDYGAGLLLLEDLGEDRFAETIAKGASPEPLYAAAVDVLAALHGEAAPSALPVPGGASRPLLAYDGLALLTEAELLTDWFLPLVTGAPTPDDAAAAYRALWAEALAALPGLPPVLVLRDYHAENLMWLEGRAALGNVGLLDFQDALAGHPAYDLISLIEDARRDVDPQLAAAMTERYIAQATGRPGFDAGGFRFAAALLAAQRNAKIVGIFARLWKRDGKPRYLSFLPRMWRYLERDLAHPALAPLQAWFDRHVPPHLRGVPDAR